MTGILSGRFVRASTLAEQYGFALKTVQTWCRTGKWPAKKIGHHWYVDVRELIHSRDGSSDLAIDYLVKSDEQAR